MEVSHSLCYFRNSLFLNLRKRSGNAKLSHNLSCYIDTLIITLHSVCFPIYIFFFGVVVSTTSSSHIYFNSILSSLISLLLIIYWYFDFYTQFYNIVFLCSLTVFNSAVILCVFQKVFDLFWNVNCVCFFLLGSQFFSFFNFVQLFFCCCLGWERRRYLTMLPVM